jgi:hypothetical protein
MPQGLGFLRGSKAGGKQQEVGGRSHVAHPRWLRSLFSFAVQYYQILVVISR